MSITTMAPVSVLQAIVDHFDGGGTALNESSPILTLARDALASGVSVPVPHALSAENLERRVHTLGSSEVAAVLGLNPYATAHQVWLAKCMGETFDGNERTELGQLLEPTIMGLYCGRYSKKIKRGDYTVGPEPWMSCTPDGLIVNDNGIEICEDEAPLCEAKLVGLRTLYQWGPGNTDEQESDAIPVHYLVQALWQLGCRPRAPYVDVSALLGTEFRSYRIWRDDRTIQNMIDRAGEWWRAYVVTKTPPPVDGSDGAAQMLKRLFPTGAGERLKADEKLEALAADVVAARKALENAETAERLAVNRMKEAVGSAAGAYGDGWNLRFKTQSDGKRPFVLKAATEKNGKAA